MRTVFIIGILLVAAFLAGWFKVQRDGDQTTIEINRREIREDAGKALNKGREFLDEHDVQQSAESAWEQPAEAVQRASIPYQDYSPQPLYSR